MRELSAAQLEQRRQAPLTHGARSEVALRPVATRQKRAFLRRNRLRVSDLDGVGAALLDNYARAQAKVELLDQHFARVGFLDAAGDPVPATRIYFTAINSARLALMRLSDHLRERPPAGDELDRVLEEIRLEQTREDSNADD